jgi:hypothetical protein
MLYDSDPAGDWLPAFVRIVTVNLSPLSPVPCSV